jgi:3-methyladenine DNA glycosylase AlkD
MSIDAERAAADIERRLRTLGDSERAEGQRRYLKSDLEHLGLTVWQLRREVRAFLDEHRLLSHDELVALVEALWSRPVFDRRMGAAMLLESRHDLLAPRDLALLERLVRESRTWALVDVFAEDVVGQLMVRHPAAQAELDRWVSDDDLWVRRAALLALLKPLKQGAAFGRFARYADAMLDEKEFFIRKAIGWVLRETGKQRPQEVFDWLASRTERVSGVTIREAVKYLAPDQQERLLSAYREKRPVDGAVRGR